MTVLFVASASTAEAVRPTALSMAARSDTVFGAPSASTGVVTRASSRSRTATVTCSVWLLPSLEAARTIRVWLLAVSASSRPATFTTPVVASIAKRPPAESSSE